MDWVILGGFPVVGARGYLKGFPQHGLSIFILPCCPSYGGKGMYGSHVHEAVIANHEKESGITIHLIDNQYDKGSILFQAKCQVTDEDTARHFGCKDSSVRAKVFPSSN